LKFSKESAKWFVRLWVALFIKIFPIGLRKHISIWLFENIRLPGIPWLAAEILADFRRENPSEYHKFLWGKHLYYAKTYSVELRFGPENQENSRRVYFQSLVNHLRALQVQPDQVKSVLEVGCSLGYQLRHMETALFPNAENFLGTDIDESAIHEGRKALASMGSNVELMVGDIEKLSDTLGDRRFDIVICTGVLMYLDEKAATACVGAMLKHTKIMLGMAGLANPEIPNNQLEHSIFREMDHSLIHNLETMAEANGGHILGVDWEGTEIVEGNSIYFVFVAPSS
jgi:SAM-dependent methyltransferase